MMTLDERQLLKRFSAEFSAMCKSGRVVKMDLSAVEAWALMSHIQLALKHPEAKGQTSEIARKVALAIEAYLTDGYPALRETAERGWRQ